MDSDILVNRSLLTILLLALCGLLIACLVFLERYTAYRYLHKTTKGQLGILCKYLNEFNQSEALLAKLTPLSKAYSDACKEQIKSVQQGGNLQTTAAGFPVSDADEERVVDEIAFRAELHASHVKACKDYFWSTAKLAQDAAGVLRGLNFSKLAPSFSRVLDIKSYKEFLPVNARAPQNE